MQEMRRGCEVTVRRCGRSDKEDDGGDYICGSAEGAGWLVVDHGGVISGLGFCVGSE
jgi:hypothetical protein